MALGEGYIVDGAELRRHETVMIFSFLHDSELVIPCLDFIYGICDFSAKGLMLVALYSNGRWLDVAVMSPGGTTHRQLLHILVIYDSFALVHGLVININRIFIAECRSDLLLYNCGHCVGNLIREWIQKFELVFLFSFRKRSHSDKFVDEPLVRGSKLLLLQSNLPLINDMNNQVA